MPTRSPIPRPSFRESKYSQSQFGKSSFQSLGPPRQNGHEMVVRMMDETDGSQADEIVHFGLDGAEFELNLSKAHAEELRRVLEPYIKAGRKTGSMRTATNKDEAEPVLDGAKQHSMKVSDSGQVQLVRSETSIGRMR
jgi:hypothetical protein